MDDWVPIIAMLSVFGLPVGAFIVFRVLAHRERMEMIRRGMVPPGGKLNPSRFSGAAQGAGDAFVPPSADASRLLAKGIRLAFTGMAITTGLSFIGFHRGEMTFGPWLLGGLIPLFIGLSQVTIAFLTDPQLFARYRATPHRNAPRAEPYYGDPNPPPAENGGAGQSYTYRPGGTQELRPPTPPPTRRP